ncbi:MAG: glycoside hydrolase family 15 protein, partial [Candidatus Dormiibacterota bacterium]
MARYTRPDGVRIDVGLVQDGAQSSALVWLVDGPASGHLLILPTNAGAGGGSGWQAAPGGASLGPALLADGPGGPLTLLIGASTIESDEGFLSEIGPEGIVIWLGAGLGDGRLPPLLSLALQSPTEAARQTRRLVAGTVARDRAWLDELHRVPALRELGDAAPDWASAAVDRSLLTLRGLQDQSSGLLVASPTTSIPQWPDSERAWDYRYAWLRDCADAGIALAHAGAFAEADEVARGLARLLGSDPETARPVHRLSGGELPPEHFLSQLKGYAGAPVRIGNGAADQIQLDTLGEVARLAGELERGHACPSELLQAVPAIADAAGARWRLPDHGIWEVRGAPQDYVHSKVMAWAALRTAAELAAKGRIGRTHTGWAQEAVAIEAAIARRGRSSTGGLVMAFQDQGMDSALLAAYLVSFIQGTTPHAAVTFEAVAGELGRGPLMARHQPERDGIAAPSFPFIFPGLWAASAEALLGRREAAQARLQAICSLSGPSGQLSEVADPESGALWGNFPQVQSHAALIDSA